MRRLIISWRIVTKSYQEISVKDNNMQSKKASLDPAAEKRARIEQKSKRIQEKGEAIARKNGTLLPFSFPKETNETKPSPKEEPVMTSSPSTHEKPQTNTTIIVSRKNSSFGIAAILAAISIFLLISVFVALTLGLFPLSTKGNNSVIQESSGNSVSDTDDSAMIEEFLNSVVIVRVKRTTGTGIGTGIILTEDGYIVTNYHVVESSNGIFVKLYNSNQYIKASLVSYKEHDDIAVLKIDKTGLRPATFVNDCSNCKVGEKVYAIGTPDSTEYAWSVTQGIISSVNRELKIYDNNGNLEKKLRTIQTDTPVNPGNSGGPLINTRGEVVGIVTMKLQDNVGMGFALPSDGILPIVTAIINNGNADGVKSTISSGRPLIGITCVSVIQNTWYRNTDTGIEPVTESYAIANPATTFFAEQSGVYVKYTTEGMDAHGKLKAVDIITKANGTEILDQQSLIDILNELHDGDTVKITYYRDDKFHEVDVSLKESAIP